MLLSTLNTARYCTKTLGNNSVIKYIPSWRTLFVNARRPVCNNSFIFARRTPLLLQKGISKPNRNLIANYTTKSSKRNDRIVGTWMFTVGGMVFVAVVLGGVTRLTESGLSMVTWKLLGEKMPTNQAEWVAEFERYQEFPEYKLINKDMTLEEFKRIWWMEYIHRMWGRLIGAAFLLPASYFWAKGMLRMDMKPRVLLLGFLIGVQGLLGWHMVQSGLEDRFIEPSAVPRVAPPLLATHLAVAFLIYAGFLHGGLDHILPAQNIIPTNLVAQRKIMKFMTLTHFTRGLIFVTAISGALVAGMDAGLIYNTFPKMADKWIPDDLLVKTPYFKNVFENPTTAQFDHRILGISTLAAVTAVAVMARGCQLPTRSSKAIAAVLSVAYLQVILGITTLLHHVPTALAASHQAGSLILLSAISWLCHEVKYLRHLPKF